MLIVKHSSRATVTFAAALALLLLSACGLEGTPLASLTTSAVAGNEPSPAEQTVGYSYDAVQVAGYGKATGVPDVATLSLGVEVIDDTVAEARRRAAESLQEVKEALTKKGIAEADIGTSHFRIRPDYDYSQEGGRTLIGYRVSNGLRVTVRDTVTDTDNVGPIIDAAVAAGGDDIVFNSLSFSFSDTSAMELQAREAAVADLAAKAGQLAEFAGRELGDLKLLTEGGGGGGGIFPEAAVLLAAGSAAFGLDTPVTAGEGEVTVIVFGVYKLGEASESDESSNGTQ